MKKNKSPAFIWDNFLQLNYAEFVEKAIKLLQNKKNDINCANDLGETALHLCCRDGLIDKFYTLIYMGADPTITTKEKNTILHYAAFYSKDMVLTQEIAKKYVSPASVNIYGYTPMNICSNEQDVIFFENWALFNKIDKKLAINDKENAFLTMYASKEAGVEHNVQKKNEPQEVIEIKNKNKSADKPADTQAIKFLNLPSNLPLSFISF